MSGSSVYFMGNALTQLVSLLLMRFVTGNITPEEYGFFNLVTTIANLAIPFITLQIADAVFRFVLKATDEAEKKCYFTISYVISAISTLLIIGITFGISYFIVPIPHTFLVALYVATNALLTIYQKLIRSLNRNVVFVSGNLIKTVIFLSLEVLLISQLHMGVEALLLAHILSTVVLILYSEIKIRALQYFDILSLRKDAFVKMMRFSVPLMPNAAFWWLTSSVNNVIVSARLGMNVNGIYTVSNKFSSTLNMVTSVLNMSWQDTAIADYGKENFKTFLTQTFNSFVKLVFSAVAVLIPLISLLLPYMVDPSYSSAFAYTPFLMLASGASVMSGFVAQIFTGKGKTGTILTTSLFGMATNILVISLLINKIGLWAAVLGSLASDCVLFASRTFLSRKEFAPGIAYKSFCVVLAMLVIGILIYFKGTPILNVIWFVIATGLAIILNLKFIKDLFTVIFGRFLRNKG